MGLYIEVPEHQNKAQQMVNLHGAERLAEVPSSLDELPSGKTLLCVVSNSMFDAVGIVEDGSDLHAFSDPYDPRPRTFLLLDTEKAEELQPLYALRQKDA